MNLKNDDLRKCLKRRIKELQEIKLLAEKSLYQVQQRTFRDQEPVRMYLLPKPEIKEAI